MTGLISRKTSRTLPLRSSTISADIKGFTARTTATLSYYNDNRSEIEGVFVLPLDHATTIVEFEAIIEGHYMFADVRDAAEVSKKKVLFETESLHDGLFKVSVGHIPPWVMVEIQVTIIGEITALFFGDALRYTLPQAFSPKVVSNKDEQLDIAKAGKHTNISMSTLRYSFSIEIEIEAPCLLYGVQSNTHPIQVDSPPLAKTGAKLVVTIPENFEPHDEVFELLMFLCRPREPYIVIEEAKQITANVVEDKDADVTDKNPINSIMNNPILMLSYSPDISTFKHDLYNTTSQSSEYFLLIDSNLCETSAGDDIKLACLIFLKCLPCNCYFNVLSYNTNFQSVFMNSQPYSYNTLESAIQFVLSIHSNFNRHSRLQPPLQWAFDQEDLAHTPKQLFIITSSMNNVDLPFSTLQQVRKKHHLARCFVFDITSNRRTHVLERLTVASRGKYCKVNEANPMRKQMLSCLKDAMQPVITDVSVSWILPEAYDVIYTPENLPSVFFGERLNLYAILATKETTQNIEKNSESATSIKEFWFEDTEMFDDYNEEQQFYEDAEEDEEREDDDDDDDEDLVSDHGGMHIKQQAVRRTQSLNIETAMRGGRGNDHDNEVFLTEEEAKRLSGDMSHPKRLSMDRVQKWRVSRFPQNCDIDSEYSRSDDIYQHGSLRDSKEKISYCQNTNSQLNLRKKSSLDGAESVGSSNSYSSNFSSGSHFYAFPGFPTRMSSCRSIEARSPHFPKQVDELFSFQETTKEKHLSIDRGSRNSLSEYEAFQSEMRKKQRSSHETTRQRLTEALVAEHANTHLIDHSNECTIERLLESAVIEKRQKLQEWLKVQEEMTQCLWPITDKEKKDLQEQYEWRDSGIGNRSSSEARTSDLEEEVSLRKKRFTRSCAQIEHHSTSEEKDTDEVIAIVWPTEVTQPEAKKDVAVQQENNKRKPNNTSLPKKRFKAKSMWNAIVDKVRSIGTIVTDRSGETKFNRKNGNCRDVTTTSQAQSKQWENLSTERRPVKRQARIVANTNSLHKDDVGEEIIEKTTRTHEQPAGKTKIKSKALKNPPIIENSRTIGTSFMFEIGKSEIGDVENLHLLPSQALIYLSGQCGRQIFKRIIPFQLEINNTQTCDVTNSNDVTVHQLAAKSIIHDLEMQMEDDNDMLENHEKFYIKHLIGEVSKAANVLSKYTTFVTTGDKCEQDEILSTLEYEQEPGYHSPEET